MTGDELLRRLAAYGVPGAPPLDVTLDAAAGEALVGGAGREKLVGLLDQALADGAITGPDGLTDAIGEAAVAVAAWCVLVERHTLAVHDLLGAAGIEHRVLKGPTVAHRFEPHPGLRTFVDVDVLVRGDDVAAAVAALEAEGHHRNQPEFRPGYDARWGKSVTMRSAAGIEVDLHRVFASGPFGLRSGPEALWARAAAAIELGGRSLPCLDADGTCVQACVHATTGARTHLATWRDVARLTLASDTAAVAELAGALGVRACVARATSQCWAVLDLEPNETATERGSWPISRRENRWLDLYAEHGDDFRALTLAGVRAVPGLRRKLALAQLLLRHQIRPDHPSG